MRNVSVLALATIGVFACFPASAEKVGNIGAVNVAAHGTPPGAAKHPLSVGLGVEKRERIETASEGSAQIVFNDTSTMTVGRSSSVVIDDFVYNGASGSQGVSLAKGVMRFVGGGVSHESGATFKTPTASIGLRGGSIMVRLGGECEALIYHQNGVTEVVGVQGNSQILNRPGFGVCARSSGVSEPFRVPPEIVAAMNAQLASLKGQSGGAKKKPREEEAELLLGHDRAPSIEPPPGLDALGPVWAGNALVQSSANVENQPFPPPAPPPPEHCRGELCGRPRL
ncbi:FecR domain-containing protein [Methylocystis iwaonis]|uniref:FecR family protein n=1 Tax=Methylocystis iwaonis TaxID=2885079 RepID=UPI002E7C385C|nr:FecR domain-containing protein [Methylocystis iwaonis]